MLRFTQKKTLATRITAFAILMIFLASAGCRSTAHTSGVSGLPLLGGDSGGGGLSSGDGGMDPGSGNPSSGAPRADVTPNDPKFSGQYGLLGSNQADIGAPGAWAYNTDCSAITVGVLDTGVDYTHPDLKDNLVGKGYNMISGAADAMDDFYHGTHCAGIIGASGNNGRGVTGICWKARIVAIKWIAANGSGVTSDAIKGIDKAREVGVKVLNNSWKDIERTELNPLLRDAVDRANEAGMLFVASAANDHKDNDQNPNWPSNISLPNVIAVASTDESGGKSSFSNWGLNSVHIAAPGSDILSTLPQVATGMMGSVPTSYGQLSGTSMAGPMVAGAAALYWSVHPTLTAIQVRQHLLDTATKVDSLANYVQGGRFLNAKAMFTK